MATKKPKKHWTTLAPERGGVPLTRNALLGHLWWWRRGEPAPDLVVPGVRTPDAVDWTEFPEQPPEGYENAPPQKKRASGAPVRQANEERARKVVSVSLSEAGRDALDRLAVRFGGNKSAAIENLILEADEKK